MSEIMLTLEAAVDNLDVNVCPLVKDAFMSTPNLAKDSAAILPSASVRMITGCHGNTPFTHIRSTSYNLVALSRKAIVSSPPILENKGMHTHT